MATGDVITAARIPGLQRPFTKYDMMESTALPKAKVEGKGSKIVTFTPSDNTETKHID
ncbi:hypothetical protein FPRO03_13194 [Fusarium proliferatum]|nr:hypothetical protein FPRO03_13194 [Fusarium proliferatum]